MELFTFVDNFDNGNPIRVRARIELISTEAGGRTKPIGQRYRPNHNFGTEENRSFYIGQIDIPEETQLHPGENKEANVTFLSGPGLREKIAVGTVWRIQEGQWLVGTGEILEVLNDA